MTTGFYHIFHTTFESRGGVLVELLESWIHLSDYFGENLHIIFIYNVNFKVKLNKWLALFDDCIAEKINAKEK